MEDKSQAAWDSGAAAFFVCSRAGDIGAHRMFTARAARSAMISNDSKDCNIIRIFAHRSNTGASVGENAVLVLKARNR